MIRTPFRLAAASLAMLLSVGAAIAQAPAPSPSAPVASVSQSHLQAGREVVTGSGMSRSFDAILPQFVTEVRQTFTTTRPELTKDLNEVIEQVRPEIEARKEEMVTTAAQVFASRLTEAELKDIGTFFNSPSGKRYVETQPLILDEMFKEMQAWTQRLSEFVVTRIRAEMKKRGHDI